MTDADREAFAKAMLKLGVAYDKTLTTEHFAVYFEALRDYELEYIEPAIGYLIRTEPKWMPRPAAIREAASQFRIEARRKALGPGLRLALGEKALTVDEVKAFLEELRARPENAEQLAEIPRKGLSDLHSEVRRLDAIGATEMTDEKRLALERFRRFSERSEAP
jgi:hypothetical protein